MKKNIRHTFWAGLAMLSIFSVVLIFSCAKEATQSLGSAPKASFTATLNSDGHSVTLVNTTAGSTIKPYWAAPGINLGYSDLKGDTIHLNFTFPNTYVVKMLVAGKGGLDSLSQNVTTTQADPTACDPSKALGFIASCTQKTWKLNPDAGAYKVGPNGPDDGSWWASNAGDVTARSCEFNDTYTFSFTAAGDCVYDNKGDFYGDGYMGDNTGSCQPTSNYTAGQNLWGSGNFKFAVIPGAGVNGIGQLKVIGKGAHIGLQKVVNNKEDTSGVNASSITYDIIYMKHVNDSTGSYDLMAIGINLGYGWWTFTLRSF